MDVSAKARITHPQKRFLKKMCNFLYYIGMGDYWYEKTERSNRHRILYTIYAVLVNGYLLLITLNEILAHLRSDLTLKEKNDLIQFCLAHPSLCAKFVSLYFQKNRIRVLFGKILDGETYRSLELEKECVKKAIGYCVTLAVITYMTLVMTTVDAFFSYKQGIPFRLEVSFIPGQIFQNGSLRNFLRSVNDIHWWCIVTNMILVDGISFTSLIYQGYKFRSVNDYFEGLRTKTVSNAKTKSEEVCAEEYEKDFIAGIKLHQNALWCARNVQSSLGNIYGAQIILSSSCLVICLIKLVATKEGMAFLVANFFYIACVLMLNGAYMMAAGDITNEASLIPTAMFHSGWEHVRTKKRFRALIVLAIESSQRPVFMTAFGVITLSYQNFITVIRSSYSFFAVMY
uniref:Odorant receptor n=1 Tax=Conogethes pinicolalis TaxID=1178461 RepID=A0A5B9GA22_9NEOP|nr:odorant receptor 45 [Conogethes pinicolalis]